MKFSFEFEEILDGVLKILGFRCFVYVFVFRWGRWGGMKRMLLLSLERGMTRVDRLGKEGLFGTFGGMKRSLLNVLGLCLVGAGNLRKRIEALVRG